MEVVFLASSSSWRKGMRSPIYRPTHSEPFSARWTNCHTRDSGLQNGDSGPSPVSLLTTIQSVPTDLEKPPSDTLQRLRTAVHQRLRCFHTGDSGLGVCTRDSGMSPVYLRTSIKNVPDLFLEAPP